MIHKSYFYFYFRDNSITYFDLYKNIDQKIVKSQFPHLHTFTIFSRFKFLRKINYYIYFSFSEILNEIFSIVITRSFSRQKTGLSNFRPNLKIKKKIAIMTHQAMKTKTIGVRILKSSEYL